MTKGIAAGDKREAILASERRREIEGTSTTRSPVTRRRSYPAICSITAVQNPITDGVLRGTGESSGNPVSNSSLARSPLKQRCRFDEFERWPHMYGVELRLPSSIHQCGTVAVSLLKDYSV